MDNTRGVEPVPDLTILSAELQDVDSHDRQLGAPALLKLVEQGDQAFRRGEVLSEDEADRHFRSRLASLRSED